MWQKWTSGGNAAKASVTKIGEQNKQVEESKQASSQVNKNEVGDIEAEYEPVEEFPEWTICQDEIEVLLVQASSCL